MAKLTRDDLMALFQATVDPEFARMLLEQPDSGVEVIEASAEVFAAASDAVERTTQGFYLRPHSAQTYTPASGEQFAMVDLDLTRAPPATGVVVLDPSTFRAEEQSPDAGDDGAVLIATGRRYVPAGLVAFLPGSSLETVTFIAERSGDGYNLPQPGTITLLDSVATVSSDSATTIPGIGGHSLVLASNGETVPPSCVGQYVLITTGANVGQRRRILRYAPPDELVPHNGVLTLAPTLVLQVSAVSGSFVPGELVEQAATGAGANYLATDGHYLAADRVNAPAFAAGSVRGVQSGATATVALVLERPDMAAEAGATGWTLLSWADLGLASTNPLSPSGGRAPTLDFIGEERDMGRSPGEPDESYRARLYSRPDVVAPNALKRAMNRVLAQYGLEGCIREPSYLDTFEGFFYDAPAAGPVGRRYAYDMDPTLRPADRYKVILSLAEYRGYFFGAVPPMALGEFGFAFDEGYTCFFDSAPFLSFFDGYAATAASIRLAVWNALDKARLGGVGFDLIEDRYGC